MAPNPSTNEQRDAPGWTAETVLSDYRIGYRSRQCSIVARKEVFSGKVKFGIFDEGTRRPPGSSLPAWR